MRGLISICFIFALLPACSRFAGYTPPYQQGNQIQQKKLTLLKPGMSKEEVAYLLGTPVINQVFTRNRWDYVATFQSGTGRPLQRQKVSIFFNKQGSFDHIKKYQ